MNLLLTGCFNYSKEQIDKLSSLGYTISFMQQEKELLPINPAEVDATVCNSLFMNHDINDFCQLKLIQLTSAGFDRVPIEKIKARGIELFNARGVYSTPMAEWAVFRVLEYYKQGWYFRKEQNANRWTKNRGLREISGTNVAVVGAGNVGQEVAKRFKAFGAKTTGFDIHCNETEGFDFMFLTKDLHEYIDKYDIIILTAPLLPSTKGMIGRDIFVKLKENAVLVNIARGGLIDEKAMCDALVERKDVFAALDVFEIEPLNEDSPLWSLENVAISPHNSFVGNGNNERMFNVMYNNLKKFIENNV